MKKYYLFILVAPFLFAFGCEKRTFEFVATIGTNENYLVDQSGHFTESSTITRDEVLERLDIPDEAEITAVNIESAAVEIIVLDDNAATAVNLSGVVKLGSSNPDLFKNYPVPFQLAEYAINALISAGVDGIENKLENYLMGSDIDPFEIELTGDSSPTAGNRIHVQILLKIKGSVKYNECMEVPFFMEGGDPCE
jgi:hypothetical protein